MKKLITSLLLTILILETITRLTPYPWVLEPSFSQMGSLRSIEYEFENRNPKIIFFGNSLTRDGISPKILSSKLELDEEEIINAGVSAGNLFLDYKILDSLFEYPKLIILQVDLNRFLNEQTHNSYYFKKLSTLQDLEAINFSLKSLPDYSNIFLKSFASSDIWHRYIFSRNESEEIGQFIPKDNLGQFKIYAEDTQLDEGFYSLETYIGATQKINDINNFLYFKKICNLAFLNDMTIGLIHLPLNFQDFDNKISKEIELYFDYLESECKSETFIINNIDYDFKAENVFIDYGHLNNDGALEYSVYLSNLIIDQDIDF
tara:strand:+ start:919 stop:1872 length:954 start_codon:yes stop_codon:yes gene_type:complete